MKISAVVFHGQGSVIIPNYFKVFCQEMKIKWFVYSPEVMHEALTNYLKWDQLEKRIPGITDIFTESMSCNGSETIHL
jgi:hypothetical protein